VTVQEQKLFDALIESGIFAILSHCDSHKCVDIHVPEIDLNIEVDGLQHYTNPEQIITDILRDNFSEMHDFHTLRVPNSALEKHTKEIVSAVLQMIDRNKTLNKLAREDV
jgi:very-short-patch-repair endonuclease